MSIHIQDTWVMEEPDLATEFAVLQEWEYIQQRLFISMLTLSPSPTLSWRQVIDETLARYTKGRAFLYWEQFAVPGANQCDRFCEVRFKQIRYGLLGLAPGYLVSYRFPNMLQRFAQTCAVLLAFAEHQELIQHLLGAVQPLLPVEAIDRLTRREQDVLLGLIRGQSDAGIAHSLGIEPTTVHTHRKRLYQRLGVHSAQEAILRSFTHRLVDWLDTSEAV